MKSGWMVALVVVVGLLGAGSLWLASSPPRGIPIQLLPPPTPAPILIHVAGAVNHPGVYTLAAGSRVQDAIEIAGGFQQEAISQTINLAAYLQDGTQLWIPSVLEPQPTVNTSNLTTKGTAPLDLGVLVNINTASQGDLETLPGIGPVLAAEIITYRETEGDFLSIEDLQKVPGIGPATFEKIQHLITVNNESGSETP